MRKPSARSAPPKDFDYGDEDFIKRMGSVEELNGETVLRIGKSVYRKVLVTGMSNMRRTTLGLLKEFADKGGSIIVAAARPGISTLSPRTRPQNFRRFTPRVRIWFRRSGFRLGQA